MKSGLIEALRLKMLPVAIIWTNDKPSEGVQFKEGKRGCVASMLVAASKGRTAFFDRKTFGCPGGGVGLGFGDCYGRWPIQCLLSTGDQAWAAQENRLGSFMGEGERFYKNPAIARKWVESLPMVDIPAEYVVLKPLDKVSDQDEVKLVHFLVNGDQLSALVVLSDYDRGSNRSVIAPFGAACQSIMFAYAESNQDQPRGVIGFFDIAQRSSVPRETLSFTVPFAMFKEMEANIAGSFLELDTWRRLQERQ